MCVQRQVSMFHPNSPIFAHIIIGVLFFAVTGCCLFTGLLPTHDAIQWHGASHYFYSSVERGILPYWNHYSQTGTPFFNNFQSFGLLIPSQFMCILFQKLTGCSTLTTYILHYFFMYYIFIIGTYYMLRTITGSNSNSLLFSLVLFLACFPSVMRQNGALHFFFLIPFITFFLLLFFRATPAKKGFYLFVVSFLGAIALLVNIPLWLLFYIFLFAILVFAFKIAAIKPIIQFLRTRYGFLWILLCVGVVLLVSFPVIELYYEFHHDTELFPSVRLLQKNGANLVKCYASDFQGSVLSEKFSQNIKVSATLGNIVGLLFEPFQHLFLHLIHSSEVVLYLSILPLFGIWVALTKGRTQYTYLFSTIAVLTLLISCNFKYRGFVQASFTQRIIMGIFPLLKMTDVLQKGGILFLFCLVILSALGFQKMLNPRNRILWVTGILFLFYKYLVFLPAMVFYKSIQYVEANLASL